MMIFKPGWRSAMRSMSMFFRWKWGYSAFIPDAFTTTAQRSISLLINA